MVIQPKNDSSYFAGIEDSNMRSTRNCLLLPSLQTHDDNRQESTPPLKQEVKEAERDSPYDIISKSRKDSSFDLTSKTRKDSSYDLTSKALRNTSTCEVSVDCFGIPTMVVMSSASDDTVSEVSVESCKILNQKQRELLAIPAHGDKVVSLEVNSIADDWPSDEEGDMKESTDDERKHQDIPISEQAAEYFAGDESCRCDFTRSFRKSFAKIREERMRRLRKKHSAIQNLCGVASRDDKEDTVSRERAFSSTCSSYEDERDTVPLISPRPGPPYRLV